jgi:hypothetical protein
VQTYDGTAVPFADLTFVDKVMLRDLLQFAVKLTDAYDSLDLR